ncbi:hypothetical protein J2W30_002180 [Variovorax boronicumulans]|uniref:hypothetical protein n=1 Tax=Variovorax boronicumulans TaxID=436515 RepID=UPI00278A0567|nr:hypothetical protein [Variovorax boronicumulans]MDQ0034425.1 hypothetical protein [Variovorax boronicumulans]MDQ0042253.1 hypothetical protein [Variovorax boronicumulans]
MDMKFSGSQARGNPSGGLCDEYRLSGIASMADLAEAARRIAADHPGCKPLFTLDDFGQARYTSGHARMNLELDDTTGHDLSGLPPECFENGKHLGYLSTKAEFGICLHNFKKLIASASFAEACAHGLTLNDESLQEWIGYQNDPVSLLDQPLSALIVPVAHAHEALAAFPNGYFSCDLDPEANCAVARHLSSVHGYELIGVGAAYLGFLRSSAPDASEASAIAADLCALYNARDNNRRALADAFAQGIAGRTYLWVRYVE